MSNIYLSVKKLLLQISRGNPEKTHCCNMGLQSRIPGDYSALVFVLEGYHFGPFYLTIKVLVTDAPDSKGSNVRIFFGQQHNDPKLNAQPQHRGHSHVPGISICIVSPIRIGLWDPFQMAFVWLVKGDDPNHSNH